MSTSEPDAAVAPVEAKIEEETASAREAALRAVASVPGAACPHCHYSLEGLAAGAMPGRCPECGGGLEAGLVGGTGPSRLKRLMVLMFAWLAFAGCMNATRRAMVIHDWVESQGPGMYGATRGSQVVVISGRVVVNTVATPVPTEWWIELGGWSVLGLLGIGGAVAAGLLATGKVRREKQLVVLLVLGFVGYWGYHGFQFVLEMAERV